MDFPRSAKSAGDFFGDLKERFSFKDRKAEQEPYYDEPYEDEGYYEDATPVDDYGPYSYDGYDGDYYDDYEYTERNASRSRYDVTSPRLVTSEDVRATTSLNTSALTDSVQPTTRFSSESVVSDRFSSALSSASSASTQDTFDRPATAYTDFVSPYQNKPAAEPSEPRGIDKLFTPSTPASSAPRDLVSVSSGAYDTLPTASASFSYAASREVTVIKPIRYQDVEAIAPAVKAGNVVAIVLRTTDAALAKRILDFSFGVAAALDARVECPAEKVFVLSVGKELTLDEKHQLRKQGAM